MITAPISRCCPCPQVHVLSTPKPRAIGGKRKLRSRAQQTACPYIEHQACGLDLASKGSIAVAAAADKILLIWIQACYINHQKSRYDQQSGRNLFPSAARARSRCGRSFRHRRRRMFGSLGLSLYRWHLCASSLSL